MILGLYEILEANLVEEGRSGERPGLVSLPLLECETSEFIRRSIQIELCRLSHGGREVESLLGGLLGPVECPGIGIVKSGGARSVGDEALSEEGETMIFDGETRMLDGGFINPVLGLESGGGKEVNFVGERRRTVSAEYRWFFARGGISGARMISERFLV